MTISTSNFVIFLFVLNVRFYVGGLIQILEQKNMIKNMIKFYKTCLSLNFKFASPIVVDVLSSVLTSSFSLSLLQNIC
jgi:hypothetical protein